MIIGSYFEREVARSNRQLRTSETKKWGVKRSNYWKENVALSEPHSQLVN